MQTNTEKIKKIIKRELKRKGITIGELSKRLRLNHRFFAEMTCIKIERLQDICNASSLSMFDVIEDENFRKYYNQSGELIKIERI